MQTLFSFVLDFLFPPTREAMKLKAFSFDDVLKLPRALKAPFPFITSLFAYKDPLVTELVKGIKNRKDGHSIQLSAFALYKKLDEENVIGTLIPIPISKKRRRGRGYNQCELLADEIVKFSNGKYMRNFDILKRTKDLGEQKLKDRAHRLESQGTFTAAFSGDIPLILIDDVVTTGSTLKEAREVLLKVGYTNVKAFSLAH